VAAGYQYLCNYARQSIHAAERWVGPLHDHDDIIQQICLEWLERAGPPDEAFPRLLEKAPAEMQLLRETVHRVIARSTYQQRKGPGQADLSGWPAPDPPAERAWLEFKSDCERGVGRLTQREWQILELRRQGHTFAEIGSTMGVPRQRVWEVYREVVVRLQHIYGRVGGGEEPA
jgi:DNA-directed RNA polymerase specialized sigma24 family protein